MPAQTATNDDNVIFETGKSETERLALQHEIVKDHFKNLVKAPIDLSKPGLKILDQATADGLWLKDVAAASPAQHEYVGTDIVDSYYPNPPPPHTTFFTQSMTADWPSSLNSTFDPGAATHTPRSVVERLVNLVAPGGYIQQSEMVFTPWPSNGPAMKEFQQVCTDIFTIAIGGQELEYLHNIEKWYSEMGSEDVQYEVYTIPIWAKAEGLVDTTKVMPPISISPERLATLPQRLREELTEIGGTWQPFAIWGRKKA